MDKTLPAHVLFWLNDAQKDCFFIVGPESGPTERIGALKLLLMGHSEIFRVMFGDGELAEKGDVKLPDVSPDTFKIFLRCIYGGSEKVIPSLSFESCVELLYVAEKYLVHDLKTEVANKLSETLSPDSVIFYLQHPICLASKTLEKKILAILKNDFLRIMTNENLLLLDTEVMLWIIQQNNYHVREVEIWLTVLKWAMGRTNSTNGKTLRPTILPLLKHIRFLTMDAKEFCEDVVTRDVLTCEEVYKICKSFGKKGHPNSESDSESDSEYDSDSNFGHLCSLKKTRNAWLWGPPIVNSFTCPFVSYTYSGHIFIFGLLDLRDLERNENKEIERLFENNDLAWAIRAKIQTLKNKNVEELVMYVGYEYKHHSSNNLSSLKATAEISLLSDSTASLTAHYRSSLGDGTRPWKMHPIKLKWLIQELMQDGYVTDHKVTVMVRMATVT